MTDLLRWMGVPGVGSTFGDAFRGVAEVDRGFAEGRG